MGSTDQYGRISTGAFRGWLTVDVSASTSCITKIHEFSKCFKGRRVFMRNVGASGQLFSAEYIESIINYPSLTQILAFTAPRRVGEIHVGEFLTSIAEKIPYFEILKTLNNQRLL